jgi:amino acid transporter
MRRVPSEELKTSVIGYKNLIRSESSIRCTTEGVVVDNQKSFRDNIDVRSTNSNMLQSRAIGLIGVLFLTVTGAAPISAMLFNVPIAVGFGNGRGAPASFLAATLVLTIFSVGYAAMARHVTAVGGFYSFISHGLGRELGLAMGLGLVVAYSVFEAALWGGFAYFATLKMPGVPWPCFALLCVCGAAFLSYTDVKLSSKILGAALIAEILILIIFNISVLITPGGTKITLSMLNPLAGFQGFDAFRSVSGESLKEGTAAIGLFFAFSSWVGFEMAPNYGEESRNPRTIVPLSLFISVIGLGIFYFATSLLATSAYPTLDDAIFKAQSDSANFFLTPMDDNVGPWARDVMSWLILTSAFACGLAFHNTCSRYLYSLGREGIFPSSLAKTHPIRKSPYVASFAQSAAAAVIVLLFVLFMGSDNPTQQAYLGLYGLMALQGTLLIIFAQAIVSLAIMRYFYVKNPANFHWFTTGLCPVIAFFAQIYIIYLLWSNLDFLGGGFMFAKWIPWIGLAVVSVGFAGALYLKRVSPEKYERIGRLIIDGD